MVIPHRPVDAAMDVDSPVKARVRALWLNKVRQRAGSFDEVHPLYFSLTGAEGRDIRELVNDGLVRLNSVGGIAEQDLRKCVAIENSPPAVARLQERFPGLKIVEKDVRSLVHAETPLAWPQGDERLLCAALVVNLDLPGALLIHLDEHLVASFPQIGWVGKIGQIQRSLAAYDAWTLCLTLNATPAWSEGEQQNIGQLITSNIDDHPPYRARVETALRIELRAVLGAAAPFLAVLANDDAQRLLCMLVPKLLAEALTPNGWAMTVEWCLFYEGGNGAPMVTFIVDLSRATPGPSMTTRLRAGMSDFTNGVSRIEENGNIQTI